MAKLRVREAPVVDRFVEASDAMVKLLDECVRASSKLPRAERMRLWAEGMTLNRAILKRIYKLEGRAAPED